MGELCMKDRENSSLRAYIENMEKENTWKEIWRDLNKKFGETICQKQNIIEELEKQIISKSLEYDMIYGANVVLKNDVKRYEERLRKSDNSIVLLSEKYQILKSNNDSLKRKPDLSPSKEEKLIYPVASHKNESNSDQNINPLGECRIMYHNELD